MVLFTNLAYAKLADAKRPDMKLPAMCANVKLADEMRFLYNEAGI